MESGRADMPGGGRGGARTVVGECSVLQDPGGLIQGWGRRWTGRLERYAIVLLSLKS